MGILIRGMEMPTSCEDCPMAFSVNFGIWGNHGVCLCGRDGGFSEVCMAIEDAPMQCIEKDGAELPKSAE